MTDPAPPPPDLAERLVAAARLRLGLPAGEPHQVTPFYPDDLDGFWAVPLYDGDQGRVVVVMTEDGEVAPHAGLARAAARLRALGLPAEAPAWLPGGLRAVLDAVGGLTPGAPRYPDLTTGADGGGMRVVFTEPEPWIHHAASGGRGAPPSEGGGGHHGGSTPPARRGTMTGELTAEHLLRWTYELEGTVLGSFEGRADDDGPDAVDPRTAETVLAAARRQIASPLAVPAAPVVATGDGAWEVELLGIGTVPVVDGPGAG